MNDDFLRDHLYGQLLKSAVQRQIFDRVSGEVLDIRRAVLVEIDPDTPHSMMDVMSLERYVSWFLPLAASMAEGVKVEVYYGPVLFGGGSGEGFFSLRAGDIISPLEAVVVDPNQGTLL
jgi:hypothetical protein